VLPKVITRLARPDSGSQAFGAALRTRPPQRDEGHHQSGLEPLANELPRSPAVSVADWDEHQLVRRCKDGSEAAFAELVRRYRPRLLTLAYHLTGERESAEDVVQETFVAAFRTLDRFALRPSLSAWLNTILVRLAARTASRAATRPRTSLDALLTLDEGVGGLALIAGAVPDVDPALAAEAAELRHELARAIGSLPFTYRAALATRYVLGLEYAEAASTLDLGLNTYKSHLLRGTRTLRARLADAVPERGATAGRVLEPGLVRAGRSAQVRATASLPLTAGSLGPR
jgi:RNA polymerase sigma-70 factor, ECF subfamily